jgi:hypothetical protein
MDDTDTRGESILCLFFEGKKKRLITMDQPLLGEWADSLNRAS